MDVEGRREFWGAIRADAERGRTVLFATHYLEEADAYADRIVLVSRGRVVADGTAAEIKAMSAGRLVTRHLGRRRRRRGRRAARAARRRGRRAARRHRAGPRPPTPTPWPGTCSPPPRARDLQITSRGLEDAFLALTGDDDHRKERPR